MDTAAFSTALKFLKYNDQILTMFQYTSFPNVFLIGCILVKGTMSPHMTETVYRPNNIRIVIAELEQKQGKIDSFQK